MKYYELVAKSNIINQVPLYYNGEKLPASSAADIVMLRVTLNTILQEKQKFLEEALSKLKKEGFDERARDVEEMKKVKSILQALEEWKEGDKDNEGNEIPKPEKPSEEAIKKAEETALIEEDFNKEKEELISAYEEITKKQFVEDIEFTKGISRETWESVYNMIGVENTIKFTYPNSKEVDLNNEIFLQYLGELIIK